MAGIPQVITEDRASGAQVIDGSLKFDGSRSTRLIKTFASAGNRTSWTWSCWVKRDILTLSNRQVIFGGYSNNNDTAWLEFGFNLNSDSHYTNIIYLIMVAYPRMKLFLYINSLLFNW